MANVRYFPYFCTMIDLAQHIEVLLLENDCVIVPGLGGFVAHYTPATRVAEENVFLPPTRIIGFNPQLKMNDGLLVQSYMAVYGTNFSDATKIVEKEVKEVFAALHEEGKAELPNVGELRYSIHDTYDFIPYDNRITTPYLYGLDSFEMQELAELKKPYQEKTIPVPAAQEKNKRKFEIKLNPTYLSNAAAMIAVVVLFFFLSTPVKNTGVVEGNYAQMLPQELFEKIEKQSLAITPIVVRQAAPKVSAKLKQAAPAPAPKPGKNMAAAPSTAKEEVASAEVKTAPAAVKAAPAETKTVPAPASPAKRYHIIVASVGTEKDAEFMAKQLVEKGFSDAKAIIGDGKMRVCIESCPTEVEAYQALNKIRQNETYQNAWVLKK